VRVVRSVLSGRRAPDGPVLAVKIDNTRFAAPQIGLAAADVVYIEPVEGGLSRMLAMYSTSVPGRIGPVRSARISDLELLAQYGRVALAYSGAAGRLQPRIAAGNLADLSADFNRAPYWRNWARPAPYNLFGDGRAWLRAAGRLPRARDVGFRFGPPPRGGRATPGVTTRYTATRIGFTWSPAARRWLLSMNGRAALGDGGRRLGGTTVVIQYVDIQGSSYVDVNGNVTPNPRTVGSGRAVVLRDGRRYEASWRRDSPGKGTRFLLAGKAMPFAPGQVWVVFAPAA
jgi:hypothetical protein